MSEPGSRWTATPLERRVKRALDVGLSLVGIVGLSPVLVAVGAAVAVEQRGSPIFRQERAGFRGRPFRLYKFKTMTDRRGDDGALLPDAERITPLGAFLRRTSIDELPELWNVLAGDMSLVGPRPLLVRYLERYDDEQRHRHDAPVGLTGWAQVSGRNALGWGEKFDMDLWYVEHWSLGLDARILLRTFMAVLDRSGISAAGEATMPEFIGRAAEEATPEA